MLEKKNVVLVMKHSTPLSVKNNVFIREADTRAVRGRLIWWGGGVWGSVRHVRTIQKKGVKYFTYVNVSNIYALLSQPMYIGIRFRYSVSYGRDQGCLQLNSTI